LTQSSHRPSVLRDAAARASDIILGSPTFPQRGTAVDRDARTRGQGSFTSRCSTASPARQDRSLFEAIAESSAAEKRPILMPGDRAADIPRRFATLRRVPGMAFETDAAHAARNWAGIRRGTPVVVATLGAVSALLRIWA